MKNNAEMPAMFDSGKVYITCDLCRMSTIERKPGVACKNFMNANGWKWCGIQKWKYLACPRCIEGFEKEHNIDPKTGMVRLAQSEKASDEK